MRADSDDGVGGRIHLQLAPLHPAHHVRHAHVVAVGAACGGQDKRELLALDVVREDRDGGMRVLRAQQLQQAQLLEAKSAFGGRLLVQVELRRSKQRPASIRSVIVAYVRARARDAQEVTGRT